MAIEFQCPTCQTLIRTPDAAAGKKARCPNCQGISSVPLTSTPPSPGNFGGGSPLPSSQPPPSATPFAPFKSTGSYQPPGSPAPPKAPAPAAWLPPADAFAPQGPPQFGSAPPPPQSNNPFGDYTPVNSGPATINPYPSPTGYAQIPNNSPYSKDEIRGKLLGPALGITICALISLAAVIMLAVAIYVDPEFHEDMKKGGDPNKTMFAYLFVTLFLLGGALPALVSLIGAAAMFRGRGLVAAWIGSIAAVLPCTPCFVISAGFAIWGMVNLNDPRVNAGLK